MLLRASKRIKACAKRLQSGSQFPLHKRANIRGFYILILRIELRSWLQHDAPADFEILATDIEVLVGAGITERTLDLYGQRSLALNSTTGSILTSTVVIL